MYWCYHKNGVRNPNKRLFPKGHRMLVIFGMENIVKIGIF